jgi:hypothetical protein
MTTLEARSTSPQPPGQAEAPPQPPTIIEEVTSVGSPLGGQDKQMADSAGCKAILIPYCRESHKGEERDSKPDGQGVNIKDLALFIRSQRDAETAEQHGLGVDGGADPDNPYRDPPNSRTQE